MHSAVVAQASPHPHGNAKRAGNAWVRGGKIHQRCDPTPSKWQYRTVVLLELVPCRPHVMLAPFLSPIVHPSRTDLGQIPGADESAFWLDRRRHFPRLEAGLPQKDDVSHGPRCCGFGSLILGLLPASLPHSTIWYSHTWRYHLPRTGPAPSTRALHISYLPSPLGDHHFACVPASGFKSTVPVSVGSPLSPSSSTGPTHHVSPQQQRCRCRH
jgi:hypothetical protein